MHKTIKFTISLLLLIGFYFLNFNKLNAQNQVLNLQNLGNVNVESLTDEQIAEFWGKMQSNGISISQLEVEAKKRNMSSNEFTKLKERINNLSSSSRSKSNNNSFQRKEPEIINLLKDSEKDKVDESDTKTKDKDAKLKDKEKDLKVYSKVFGAELFNNKNLTFEPNLRLATPQNYQLGPDDELLIDIYGYSEESMSLKVSPDGNIKIPLVGIVQVSGLTIEQAKIRIKSHLSKTYERINTGETKVNITLGNIRSIKVLIIGEVYLPGTYTISSLATVFNALYFSGGPNVNGSMRNIKVIRNSKTIAVLDIYDFMLKGDSKGNIRLQDQDVIKVGVFENKVEFRGEIKRNAHFELLKNETLKDLIYYAGGYTNNAFSEKIKVIRNTNKEKSIIDVSQDQYSTFKPQSGDYITVDKLLERFENRVQIKGAVFRPGYYGIDKQLTILKLIKLADGLKEDAFTNRVIIYRLREDNSLSMLSVNLTNLKEGSPNDILLQREDLIQIASKLDLKEKYKITINGEVLKPGEYPYAQNMKIEDLIIAAGGYKETAALSRVEVSRRKFDIDKTSLNSEIAIVKRFEISKDLHENSNLNFELEPFDIVNIYTITGYSAQKNVTIIGEVLYPGIYTIEKTTEKISDLLKKCGGLTASGSKDGVVLLRNKIMGEAEKIIEDNKLKALKKLSKDTADVNDKIEEGKEIGNENDYDIVGLDIDKILKNPGSKYDLLLREGDLFKVPYEKQTVFVSGEVLYPVNVNINNAKRLHGFVNNAGGFTSKALRRKSYVVYANGGIKATNSFLFFKFYPKIKPGCEIVIPKKETKKIASIAEITTVTTSLITLFLLIYTVRK